MKFINSIFFLTLFLTFLSGCKNIPKADLNFSGEKSAIDLANQMFKAIGGKSVWCELRSLYIKAEHTEPQMEIPYQSEIWRAIDQFDLVIEQQNDSFHVKGVFNESAGTIRYFDKRDTFRNLTDEQLQDWKFGHNHNIYVLLHDLACRPEDYSVEIDKDERLAFYQNSVFVTSFVLDEQLRPHIFYHPNSDGTVSGSRFTHFGNDGGLVHSAGGHPLDSNFMYRTELWQPSNKSLEETFGKSVYDIDKK